MDIESLDHLVLTVADIDATMDFYTRVLGMRAVTFGDNRRALAFGDQKINLHPAAAPYEPKAKNPTPGSADLCFLTATPLADVQRHLQTYDIAVEVGPIERTGATWPIRSVYVRDPNDNLIEIANRQADHVA